MPSRIHTQAKRISKLSRLPRSRHIYIARQQRTQVYKRRRPMDNIFQAIMSGRIMRQIAEFAEFAWGRTLRWKTSLADQRTVKLELGLVSKPGDTNKSNTLEMLNLGHGDGGSLSSARGGNRSSQTDALITEGDTGFQSQLPSPSFGQPMNPVPQPASSQPPLNAPYLDIFSFQAAYGDCSALTLTPTVIWQLNTVFRYEAKVAQYLQQMTVLDGYQSEVDGVIAEMNDQLQMAGNDDYEAKLEALGEVRQMSSDLQTQRQGLQGKLQHATEEIAVPKSQLYRDLKEVMAEYNLLDEIPENSDLERDQANSADEEQDQQMVVQTPHSEVAEYEAETARQDALELVKRRELSLQDAREKVNNWETYYDNKHRKFLALTRAGGIDSTQTEFDLMLLKEQRAATAELIQAEEHLADAKRYAKSLGVIFNMMDQESGFLDYPDDGYRESTEADIAAHVDRGRIERWMDEENNRPGQSTDCDNWDAKSVDLCDSVSVVAEGRERKRIDRWRSTCELTKLEIQAETEGECE